MVNGRRITDNEWVTYHFHHLGLEKKKLISFLEILNNVKDTEVWIRNFILKELILITLYFSELNVGMGISLWRSLIS